jgi:hypothetical protein
VIRPTVPERWIFAQSLKPFGIANSERLKMDDSASTGKRKRVEFSATAETGPASEDHFERKRPRSNGGEAGSGGANPTDATAAGRGAGRRQGPSVRELLDEGGDALGASETVVLNAADGVRTGARDDEADDGEDAEERRLRRQKLARVKGEHVGPMVEEFNDAGDAFEPFNLYRERTEGHFDAAGNYYYSRRQGKDASAAAERQKRKGRLESGAGGGDSSSSSEDSDAGGEEDAWLAGLDDMDPRERARLQEKAAAVSGFVRDRDREARDDEDEDRQQAMQSTAAAASSKKPQTAKSSRKSSDDDTGEDDDDEEEDEDEEGAKGDGSVSKQQRRAKAKVRALQFILSCLRTKPVEKETVSGLIRRLGLGSNQAAAAAKPVVGAARKATLTRDEALRLDRLIASANRLVSLNVLDIYGCDAKQLTWMWDDAVEEAGEDIAAATAAIRSSSAAAGNESAAGVGASVGASAVAPAAAVAAAAAFVAPTALFPDKLWEYCWTVPASESSATAAASSDPARDGIFGPFRGADMLAWIAAGYFTPERPVFVRPVVVVPTAAPAAVEAPAAKVGADSDDDDDDIFGGAGTYKAPAAVAPATWMRFDDRLVQF